MCVCARARVCISTTKSRKRARRGKSTRCLADFLPSRRCPFLRYSSSFFMLSFCFFFSRPSLLIFPRLISFLYRLSPGSLYFPVAVLFFSLYPRFLCRFSPSLFFSSSLLLSSFSRRCYSFLPSCRPSFSASLDIILFLFRRGDIKV